jgi:hypothetical protein
MRRYALNLVWLITVAITYLSLSSYPSLAAVGLFGWGLLLALSVVRTRFFAAGIYRSRLHGFIHLLGLVLVGTGVGALFIGGAAAPLLALELRVPTAAALSASTITSLMIIALGMLVRHYAVRVKPATVAA